MDKIRQVAGKLGQTKDDSETVLKRNHKSIPLIHRTRDVIGVDEEFSMEFTVPTLPAVINLNLFFMPAGILCNEEPGCFTGRCDYFTGSTSTVLTTVYQYVPGVVYAYKNDAAVTFTETGANEITLDSAPLAADHITVCYVYQTCEYNPDCAATGQTVYYIDDFNRIVSDGWGTASIGEPWIPDADFLTNVVASVDGAAGHATNTVGSDPSIDLEIPNDFQTFLGTQSSIDILWLIDLSGATANVAVDFVNVYNEDPAEKALSFQYNKNVNAFQIFVNNGLSTQFGPLSATYTTSDSFWAGWRLYADGTLWFKHWNEFAVEPLWGSIPLPTEITFKSQLTLGSISHFSMRFLSPDNEEIFKAIIIRACPPLT